MENTKTIGSLANELGISISRLEHAMNKIPNWLSIKGKSHQDLKVNHEVVMICKKFSKFFPVSDELANIIIDQYQTTADLISLSQIIKSYSLPKQQTYSFVKEEKQNTLIDYWGSNIFLKDKEKYVSKRKLRGFLQEFFVHLLMHTAKTSGYLFNDKKKIYEEFFALEEIQVGNSRRGRILGFYKNQDHENVAIVGFYNGDMSFQKHVKKFSISEKSQNFKKEDTSKRPIVFSFDLKDLLDKEQRCYINILLESRRNRPFTVVYGGNRANCTTTAFELDLDEFDPKRTDNKADSKLYQRIFGNVSVLDLQKYLKKHMISLESYCKPKSKTPNKLICGANLYPLTIWTKKSILEALKKFGINGKLSNSVLIETLLSRQTNISEYDTEDAFIKSMDSYIYENYRENNELLLSWEKILGTDNPTETFRKIDGILKGRIKLEVVKQKQPDATDDTSNIEDELDQYLN